MTSGRLPKPSITDVAKDSSIMVYVDTEKMGIGARSSGLPKSASTGPGSLEHVGGSAGKKK